MLFVISLNLLLQEQICINSDLEQIEILLKQFVSDFENLYGEAELTYNLHQILHIVLHIRRWGPVWGNSAFTFEGFIGTLSKMIHGNQKIAIELINKTKLSQGLQVLKNKEQIQLLTTCDKCLGKSRTLNITEHERYLIESADIMQTNFKIFARAKIKGQIYTFMIYKALRTINYCIRCRIGENSVVFGLIKYFLSSEQGIFFVLQPFQIDNSKIMFDHITRIKVKHILPIKEGGPSILLRVNNVKSMMKVLLIQNNYICIIPKTIRKCLL